MQFQKLQGFLLCFDVFPVFKCLKLTFILILTTFNRFAYITPNLYF
nr:MAG TPA: hypothetical protein [Caudoviricetes sp.]